MEDKFLAAMQRRFACKRFLQKSIPQEDFDVILEYARLSPSSFGMEPWRLLVITDQKIKEELQPLCWNQKQITTCSHLVVIKADRAVVQDKEYIAKMFARRGLSPEATRAYIDRYFAFLQKQDIDCWVQKQCYIAAANMMTGAAYRGIDSCPIEGFEKEKVEEYLQPHNQSVALMVAFGYCAMERPPKKRLQRDEIVEFR
ncbi:hypothetical protein NitYY0826_C2039 [Nitratiruptor sp. YY08-26]|uniref:NAD(P)H-dependent oxidoreductase n=1 Tax=unclassified Nitratiruptor TaxID=2624044 RepID=UPI00191594DE|nr:MULTISPECIES: NAD(P)H-dependent oxidoreductase [unclassified Nitratiruptor]BCD63145.1 hypothetical protein NitYY0813_C2037 [Nitratiruptor sp. YY08-13]BCD67080.1 hypothetical protein NitYY0826_C2039 [Nitratiruptor sp. YY08-26]